MDLNEIKIGDIYFKAKIGGIDKYLEIVDIKEDHIEANILRTEDYRRAGNYGLNYKTTTISKESIKRDKFTYSNYSLVTERLLEILFTKIFSGKAEFVK